MHKIPIIIDTDPGVDDCFAIMLMQTSARHSIKALTVTAGNVGIRHTLRNTLGLCELIDLDAPVHAGADRPLIIPLQMADDVHGANGLGGYSFEQQNRQPEECTAWDAIAQIARSEAGQLEILSLGPPTNIALALLHYPEIKPLIRRIVVMGGTTGTGNTYPYSEFNFWCDPHAAQVVLESGIPLEMVGLNATRQALMNLDEMAQVGGIRPAVKRFIDYLTSFYVTTARTFGYGNRLHIPDAVAAAVMIKPEICTFKPARVRCVTEQNAQQGRSVVDFHQTDGLTSIIDVAVKIEPDEYKKMMFSIP